MPIDASDRTLGLISIWQVLRKFVWEVALLKAMPEKIRVGEPPADLLHVQDARIYGAINACATGLSLVDWLYYTARDDPELCTKTFAALDQVDLTSDKLFLRSMREINRAINVCHQVCNANKHFHLHSPDKKFKIMVAELVMEHTSGETELAVKMLIMDNGEGVEGRGHIEELLAELSDWWYDKLNEIQVPGRDVFFQKPT